MVGGLITGAAQLVVERSRANHEKQLESERARRVEEVRNRETRQQLRSAARTLSDDLDQRQVLHEFSLEHGRWWPPRFTAPNRTTVEDRRILTIHLPARAWEAVGDAWRFTELCEMGRELASDVPPTNEPWEELLRRTVELSEQGKELLAAFASDD